MRRQSRLTETLLGPPGGTASPAKDSSPPGDGRGNGCRTNTLISMEISRKLALIDEQISAVDADAPSDFTRWRETSKGLLRNLLGPDHELTKQLTDVRYTPNASMAVPGRPASSSSAEKYRQKSVRQAISILNSAKDELMLQDELNRSDARDTLATVDATPTPQEVFIVHGRNDHRKHEFARVILALTGTEPIILHEQRNGGQVLIEKFEANANRAGFAVVLLTADDYGREKSETSEQPRARQNVIFEMGFFYAALGRHRVAAFLEEGVEEPGDVRGVVYNPIDNSGGWKNLLARELAAAGIDVDYSALVK